ncbi:MAG: DUF1206 domain-containing protein [Bdellovibrionales bacterium]
MKHLGQIGCLARSVVYFLVGTLALLTALGSSYGATTDESGVFRKILEQRFGPAMLLTIAVGLLCYGVWRFVQTIQDHDKYGRKWPGLGVRIGLFGSGVAHAFFGLYALNLVFQWTHTTRIGERVMAKWVMMQPFGRFFLFVIGFAVVITGFVQFVRALNGSFARDLKIKNNKRTVMLICRFGLVARGIVFSIIGTFLMQAAWKYRSREAGGLHKAWETLREQPYGNFLVATVAVGFMAFAAFGVIEGFYRKRTH